MNKFAKRIGILNTTYNYKQGISLCANTEVCYMKIIKKKEKPRKSMGRSLALRRSTNRHK